MEMQSVDIPQAEEDGILGYVFKSVCITNSSEVRHEHSP